MKRKYAAFAIIILGSLLTIALAQGPPQAPPQPPPPGPNDDPLGPYMFPPELVMQHQREIGLTDEQKTYMRGEIQKVTVRFNELQWQLQDAMEALGSLMKETTVNEQAALAQLDKVLDAEREIKRLHIGLAVRIKNKLTPEQQARLQQLKRMGPPQPRPMP
jgi:Spy/CpxP family protein refolding chaperone